MAKSDRITLPEASARTGISIPTIYRRIRQGEIRGAICIDAIGKHWEIFTSELPKLTLKRHKRTTVDETLPAISPGLEEPVAAEPAASCSPFTANISENRASSGQTVYNDLSENVVSPCNSGKEHMVTENRDTSTFGPLPTGGENGPNLSFVGLLKDKEAELARLQAQLQELQIECKVWEAGKERFEATIKRLEAEQSQLRDDLEAARDDAAYWRGRWEEAALNLDSLRQLIAEKNQDDQEQIWSLNDQVADLQERLDNGIAENVAYAAKQLEPDNGDEVSEESELALETTQETEKSTEDTIAETYNGSAYATAELAAVTVSMPALTSDFSATTAELSALQPVTEADQIETASGEKTQEMPSLGNDYAVEQGHKSDGEPQANFEIPLDSDSGRLLERPVRLADNAEIIAKLKLDTKQAPTIHPEPTFPIVDEVPLENGLDQVTESVELAEISVEEDVYDSDEAPDGGPVEEVKLADEYASRVEPLSVKDLVAGGDSLRAAYSGTESGGAVVDMEVENSSPKERNEEQRGRNNPKKWHNPGRGGRSHKRNKKRIPPIK